MKKLFYVGLLVYVFWMDEEQKAPYFKAFGDLLAQIPSSSGISTLEKHANNPDA